MKRFDPYDLLTDDTSGPSLDELCDGIEDDMQKRSNVSVASDSAEDDPDAFPSRYLDFWNAEIHNVVARLVAESIMVLLVTTTWKLRRLEGDDGCYGAR